MAKPPLEDSGVNQSWVFWQQISQLNSILNKSTIIRKKRFGFPKGEFWGKPPIWSLGSLSWLSKKSHALRDIFRRCFNYIVSWAGGFQMPFFLKLLNLFSKWYCSYQESNIKKKSRGTLLAERVERGGWKIPRAEPALAITTPLSTPSP